MPRSVLSSANVVFPAEEFHPKSPFVTVGKCAVSKRLFVKPGCIVANFRLPRNGASLEILSRETPKARLFKNVFFSGVNSGIGHEPNRGVTTVDVLQSQLPAGKTLTIAVRPISSLGTKGKAIATKYKA